MASYLLRRCSRLAELRLEADWRYVRDARYKFPLRMRHTAQCNLIAPYGWTTQSFGSFSIRESDGPDGDLLADSAAILIRIQLLTLCHKITLNCNLFAGPCDDRYDC